MSSLKTIEKRVLEKLFNRNKDGYVLDFTDQTFAEFFREHEINIEDDKYHKNGPSKMKRLKAFWEIEPDQIVGKVLDDLLQIAYKAKNVDPNDKEEAEKIISRLLKGVSQETLGKETESDFLKQEFKDISIDNG